MGVLAEAAVTKKAAVRPKMVFSCVVILVINEKKILGNHT
ncbi:hypothetical protein NEISICOT_02788 [Neisseria sicca ATCC 29256]|uniref:Uncharacterized protein n=1 Tax=Neisseria sicca ATCC 29256 TaxID=547045 RepID=C6M8B9_NEISI|nr:hypothetical protein NEISICOT_02788 [Neisseria sicca ATCC 29256]